MSKPLISLFIVATFAIAASGSAFAADIAVKASPPFYNWTGWYAGGGQVGYDSQFSPTGVSR